MSEQQALLPWLAAPLAQGLALRAHALLLHGPGAVGQFELGLALATGWLCEADDSTLRPCGHCASCHLMAAHMHPDFYLLLPDALREPLGWHGADEEGVSAGKAKPSKEIRVEQVRAAIDWGHKTMSRERAKVMLIHPAQAMNPTAANALLKTLEEPAGRLRLVLTAHDPEALLPTVRSRCQRLPLDRPPAPRALEWLATAGVTRPEVLLAASGGQPLEALAMATDGIDSDAWEQFPGAVRRGLAALVADWTLVRLVDALQKLCHDLMCLRADAAPRYFSAAVLAPLMQPRAPQWPALAQWAQDLTRAAGHDEHPWHAGLRSEALVGQGARLWQTARSRQPAASGPLDTLSAR
ncbi:MAG: DNA polymerase III subunit delta' [Burkholderiaceae bacterium]|nr:DNA polymerase III subunit delta' [Burkholderiaceae bacterium]